MVRTARYMFLIAKNALARANGSFPQDAVANFWEESLKIIDNGPVSVGDQQLFRRFILDMVCLDPHRRLGTRALLKHKYISDT